MFVESITAEVSFPFHFLQENMNHQVTDIGEADERDGIRFTFNTWPGTRMEATKCVIPMGCLYSLDTLL